MSQAAPSTIVERIAFNEGIKLDEAAVSQKFRVYTEVVEQIYQMLQSDLRSLPRTTLQDIGDALNSSITGFMELPLARWVDSDKLVISLLNEAYSHLLTALKLQESPDGQTDEYFGYLQSCRQSISEALRNLEDASSDAKIPTEGPVRKAKAPPVSSIVKEPPQPDLFDVQRTPPQVEATAADGALPSSIASSPVQGTPVTRAAVAQEAAQTNVPNETVTIAIRALADSPSDIDLLQFSDYADALVDFIKSEKTQKPLTIAIDAAWGMGKTTLMRMIKSRLEGKTDKKSAQTGPSFPIVWFNAWQYDQEDSLWAALVLEILDQVRQQFTLQQKVGFWWDLTQRRLGRQNRLLQLAFRALPLLLGVAILVALLVFVATVWKGNSLVETIKPFVLSVTGTLGVIGLIYASVNDFYTRIIKPYDQQITQLYQKLAQYVQTPNYKDRIGFLAQFKDDFAAIVETATSGGKWPLIIFIDDLDRCAPPKPVEIIEAINLLLDAQYCVFIMGMDMRTVAGSIEAKYKDLLTYISPADAPGELSLGQRFLEKIIQITFRLPRADAAVVQTFIDTILTGEEPKRQALTPSDEHVQVVAQLIEAQQRVGAPLDAAAETVKQARPDVTDTTIAKAKEEVRAKSFDDSQVVLDAMRLIAPYLELNPRKIKRFINLFRLQALIANRRGLLEAQVVKLDTLAKWIVIATRWPSMVDALLADPDFLTRLQEACRIKTTIKQKRLGYQPNQQGPDDTYEGFEARNITYYQAKLDTMTADPHIKTLAEATELMELLDQLTEADIQALPVYLHLTRVTSQVGSMAPS